MLKKRIGFASVCLILATLPSLGFCASDPLAGTYNIATNGTAQLGQGMAMNGGQCQATGNVGAALWRGTIVFENGSIKAGSAVSYAFPSMGGTKCNFGFNVTGTYTVLDMGNGAFQAAVKMSIQGNSNVNSLQVACGDQFVISNFSFTVNGNNTTKTYDIVTAGADSGSNYVEGQGRVPTCVAPIMNFNTGGTAVRVEK